MAFGNNQSGKNVSARYRQLARKIKVVYEELVSKLVMEVFQKTHNKIEVLAIFCLYYISFQVFNEVCCHLNLKPISKLVTARCFNETRLDLYLISTKYHFLLRLIHNNYPQLIQKKIVEAMCAGNHIEQIMQKMCEKLKYRDVNRSKIRKWIQKFHVKK